MCAYQRRSSPGLDPTALRGLLRPPHDTDHLVDQVRAHLELHDGYLAFSGGKDSLVALHLARQADPNVPVCFFDDGLAYPETYTYIADLTAAWNLNLEVIRSPKSTLEILVADGSWSHHRTVHARNSLMSNKITKPATIAHQRYGPGLIWGLRADESEARRRMFTASIASGTPGSCHRTDETTTFSPVWNWSTNQIWGHIARYEIPVNPVYEKLRRLGAPTHAQRVSSLLDAGHLELGRMVWLKRGWPELYQVLVDALPRAAEYA